MWVGICCDDMAQDEMISRLYQHRSFCSPTVSSAIHVAAAAAVFFLFGPVFTEVVANIRAIQTPLASIIVLNAKIKIASNLKSSTMEYSSIASSFEWIGIPPSPNTAHEVWQIPQKPLKRSGNINDGPKHQRKQ